MNQSAKIATSTSERADRRPSLFGHMFGSLANNPHYRTYWMGNQANMLVMSMQMVANGYLAYILTNSATALGVVSLAGTLPAIIFSPIGGVVSDRIDKRTLLLVIQAMQCLTSVAIATLVAFGVIAYWHLVVVSAIQAVGFAFMMPARQGWIPQLVSREDMANAIALNNAGMNAGRIIGPTLAGVLIAVPWFGVSGVYYLRVAAFALVMYSLLRIPITGKPDTTRTRGNFWDELTLGYRYIFHHETLNSLFVFAFVITVLGMSYQALLPAFALGVFNVGSEGQGLMQTAVGVGALVGSLTMAYISRSPNKARIQAYTGAALGIGLVGFGLCAAVNAYLPALAMLFVVGLALDFNATINNTLIMLNTDTALYGRVMAVYMMTAMLAPATAPVFGAAMDTVGGGAVMIAVGLIVTVFVVAMATMHPGYKKIRSFVT